jgi:hypothetical protein
METHPPRLIEAIIERLVPPACRESVLGDWNERYASVPEYVLRALSALPFLVASQVRRTFKVENVVSEAVAIYLAFALEFFVRPASLLAQQVLIPILIVICTALLALVIRDAYADPEDRSAARTIRDACIAIGAVVSVEAILSVSHLSIWMLPWLLVFSGGAASIPMLFIVRWLLRPAERNRIAAALDQLRRRAEDEHRKAWQLNLMWLVAGVALIVGMPNVSGPREDGVFAGLFLITVLFLGYTKSKSGFTGTEQEYASLSISQDAYRTKLERKRDGLRHWVGGGLFNWKSAGATFVFFLLGLDLFPILLRWMTGLPMPARVSTKMALAVLGVIILSMFWTVVRTRSLHAARTIQDELDALDKVERKQP